MKYILLVIYHRRLRADTEIQTMVSIRHHQCILLIAEHIHLKVVTSQPQRIINKVIHLLFPILIILQFSFEKPQ